MPTAVRSHAKINLGLGIGGPRPDGFHGLVTVYQTLEMHDRVEVSATASPRTYIELTSNDERVPTDARNTAWKMVELALDSLSVCARVSIHIDKKLPVQGGLGAGSANAVAALVGLEAELRRAGAGERCGMGDHVHERTDWPARRLGLAAQVGSDVPLFLIGGAVLGLDRGQQVVPLPDFEPVWCVVATPSIGVSTPQAFADWDAHCLSTGLTAEASAVKLSKLSSAYASAFAQIHGEGSGWCGSSGVLSKGEDLAGPLESALVRTGILRWITNDFEQVVFPQHPSLCVIKRLLEATGTPEAALHASLSGSGSALFAFYRMREAAEAAIKRLRPEGVQSYLTRTIPRREYWSEMLAID